MRSMSRSSSSRWCSLVTWFVVFVERGQRKILVNYARRQGKNKVYGGQSSHLSSLSNMAGGFRRSSSVDHPAAGDGRTGSARDSMRWLKDIASALAPDSRCNIDVLRRRDRVFLFLLHGAQVQQQPRDGRLTSKRVARVRSGIRPRRPDRALHRQEILVRLTLAGAGTSPSSACCRIPDLKYNVPFYLVARHC